MALICLEGSDGGGKSFLAGKIAESWLQRHPNSEPVSPAHVIHTGPPPDPQADVFADYELPFQDKSLFNRVMSDRDLVILDRWHLGDRIYGPKYRGFARYTEAGLLHTEMVLSSLGAVKVICSPPLDVVQKRVAERGDDYINQEDLPRIHAEYLQHGKQYDYFFYGDGVFLYDSQEPESAANALIVIAIGKSYDASELAAASDDTYTGALYPDIIIAGDELGGTPEQQRKRGGFTRPFTPNSPATSCEWFMSALYQAGYLNNTGLVNVNHPDVDVAQLAQLRPDTQWVALGVRASATLKKTDISD